MKRFKHTVFSLFFVLAVSFLIQSSGLAAYPNSAEYQPGFHDIEFKNAHYLVFLPMNFDPERKHTLIVISFMYNKVTEIEPQALMDAWTHLAEEREYVLILPMVGGIDDKIIEWYRDLLKEVKARYSINRSHILLTSFGEGADFAFYIGTTFPEEFSAVSPVSGSLKGTWGRKIHFKKRDRLPFYIFSGQKDSKVSPDKVRDSAETLKQKGYEVTYEEVSGMGHEYPEAVTQKIADWFDNLA